jgi:hypothetical protein
MTCTSSTIESEGCDPRLRCNPARMSFVALVTSRHPRPPTQGPVGLTSMNRKQT